MCIRWVALLLLPAILAQDSTLTGGTSGSDVVESVVNSIRESCLFHDDKLFLRRVAYVASRDGTGSSTYRPGYNGGIWQLDLDKFNQIKSSPIASALFAAIQRQFRINWSTVVWSDLRKPLYSGIAAALYLETLSGSAQIPRGIEDQAAFYAQHYSQATDAAHDFLLGAQNLQQGCQRSNLDLVFIVDTSSSLSITDFNRAKNFTSNIVDGFKIGPSDVRVAYVTFSTGAKPQFFLSDHFTNNSIKAAIQQILYAPGHTDTDKAITFAADTVFTKAKGSRDGTSKVVILITDGRSTDRDRTVQAAQAARAKGIIFYSIGVGSVDKSELDSIATKPVCTHAIILKDYSGLSTLTSQMQQVSCRAPAILYQGVYTFSCGQSHLFLIPLNGTHLLTSIGVTDGQVNIYGSFLNPTPNAAFKDFGTAAVPVTPAVIFIKGETRPMYLTIGASDQPRRCTGNVTVSVTRVQPVTPKSVVTCDDARNIFKCSVINILKDIYYYINPPYTITNPCMVGFDGFHIHPTLQTQFVYCLNGHYYIFACAKNHIFNIHVYDCVPGQPVTPTPTHVPVTTQPVATPTRSLVESTCHDHCPSKDGDLYFYPHPDPHSYIHCNQFCHGFLKQCPLQRVWKQEILQCVPNGPAIG